MAAASSAASAEEEEEEKEEDVGRGGDSGEDSELGPGRAE